jgi:hypothetical protein
MLWDFNQWPILSSTLLTNLVFSFTIGIYYSVFFDEHCKERMTKKDERKEFQVLLLKWSLLPKCRSLNISRHYFKFFDFQLLLFVKDCPILKTKMDNPSSNFTGSKMQYISTEHNKIEVCRCCMSLWALHNTPKQRLREVGQKFLFCSRKPTSLASFDR